MARRKKSLSMTDIEQCEERKLENKYMVKPSFYRHIFEKKRYLQFMWCWGKYLRVHQKCSVCFRLEESWPRNGSHWQRKMLHYNGPQTNNATAKVINVKKKLFKANVVVQLWCPLYNQFLPQIYFFTLMKDVANRGSNEIASCFLWFCQLLKE